MKKLAAFAMLFVGLGLAAAYGARNGDTHAAYRQALSELPVATEALDAAQRRHEAFDTQVVEARAEVEEAARCARHWGFDVDGEWLAAEGLEADCDDERRALEDLARSGDLLRDGQPVPARAIGACECRVPEDAVAMDPAEAWPAGAERLADLETELAKAATELETASAQHATLSAAALPSPGQRLAEWFDVGGVGWLGGVFLIIAGAVLARKQIEAEHRGEGDAASEQAVDFLANVREIRRRLDQLAANIAKLPMDEDVPEAREVIDTAFAELIEPIVDARGRFTARHGVAVFASYFGAFAGGERNLSRTWSALTDGHAEEARASLAKAIAAFAEAEAAWHAAEGGPPDGSLAQKQRPT